MIIPAGGTGTRLNLDMPKQFHNIAGKPIIIHTIEKFEQSEYIDSILIACHKDWVDFLWDEISKYKLDKVSLIIEGGETRQESVFNVIKIDYLDEFDIVLVHDAVRMFVDEEIIGSVINTIKEFGAAIPCININDTIKFINGESVDYTPKRDKLRAVQTPQGAKTKLIKKAYFECENILNTLTDDSSILEKAGFEVGIAKGKKSNFKITSEIDLKFAEYIIGKE